ncbi:hypothetical protein CVT24_010874, partial [Panaeolus cyanescens]
MTTTLARQQSPSPSSRSLTFGSRISALGAKISRSMSRDTYGDDKWDDENGDGGQCAFFHSYLILPFSTSSLPSSFYSNTTMSAPERSTSRGRDAFQSSGRGGLGNIRQASQSRDARPDSGPDDFSVTRGREPVAQNNAPLYSTGRGGAGNIRSPSRGPNKIVDIAEETVIRDHIAKQEDAVTSTGRGGLGNLAQRSRSRGPGADGTPGRSRSRGPDAVFSTGRGGAGNIRAGDVDKAATIDEEERRKVGSLDGAVHSTGRGGLANLTSGPAPGVESVPHAP